MKPAPFLLTIILFGVLLVGVAQVQAASVHPAGDNTSCVTASTGGTVCFANNLDVPFDSVTAISLTGFQPPPPTGLLFPYGLFSFTISELGPNQPILVTLTLPNPLPPGQFAYYKFSSGAWTVFGGASLNSARTVITLTLTADLSGNINDPADQPFLHQPSSTIRSAESCYPE